MDDELVHDYDANKRREYYLRTRQLRGRSAGAQKAMGSRRLKAKPPTKTRAQRQAERRKQIEAQVNALKARLEKLRTVLDQLTKQAQAGSRAKPKSSENASSEKKSPDKKLTAGEKAKAAKASEEYRKKNKDLLLADEVKSLNGKIKTIQDRIAKMRKNGSIGVQRNPTK